MTTDNIDNLSEDELNKVYSAWEKQYSTVQITNELMTILTHHQLILMDDGDDRRKVHVESGKIPKLFLKIPEKVIV